jgi:hypothetical protein
VRRHQGVTLLAAANHDWHDLKFDRPPVAILVGLAEVLRTAQRRGWPCVQNWHVDAWSRRPAHRMTPGC